MACEMSAWLERVNANGRALEQWTATELIESLGTIDPALAWAARTAVHDHLAHIVRLANVQT